MPTRSTPARRPPRTPWVVLGLLAYEPMTGYDLKATIERTVGHFWQESFGQLYPTLRDLRAQGLVSMTEAPDGQRMRKEYATTPAGRDAFLAWLAEPPQASPIRNELLLKVFFASLAGPEALRPLLEHALAAAHAQRATLGEIRRDIDAEPASDFERRCWALTVDLGLRNADAVEAWAHAGLATLEPPDGRDAMATSNDAAPSDVRS